jgi:hypothetical protein
MPYGILRALLCCILKQVLEVVGLNKSSLERYIGPMIRWAAHAPVAETLIIKLVRVICKTYLLRVSATVSESGMCSSKNDFHVSSSNSSSCVTSASNHRQVFITDDYVPVCTCCVTHVSAIHAVHSYHTQMLLELMALVVRVGVVTSMALCMHRRIR